MGLSANFCQFCLSSQALLSTSVKFPWFRRIFCQHFLHSWDLLSTSVKFPCVRSTFHQLPSTFRAPTGSSVKNLPATSVDFPCICRTYRKLASIYRETGGPLANFPYVRLTFCQHSLRPQDLSTLFNFPLLLGSSSSSTEIPTPNS